MFNIVSMCLSNVVFLILHVISSGSFPKPLSAKEERSYLEKMKQGDKTARDVLVERNLRLVAHIIKKYYSTNGDQDDLVSIGTIGLIKAVNTFNPDKGIRLSSYASRCIENEILMFFRGSKKSSQDISIDEPIDTDKEGNSLTLMDVLSTDDSVLEDIDTKVRVKKLKQYLPSLNDREKKIIILRYGLDGKNPFTQKEISKMLGISRSYVSRIEKKALEKLRKKFDSKSFDQGQN